MIANSWKKLPGTGIGGTPSTAQTTPNTNATVKPLGAGAWQPKPVATTPAAQPAAKPVQPAPAGQSAIRQYLLDNGIGNDQIGYNKANNSVTVGGQSFITPATVQGGTSYATKDSLDQALAGYQNKQTYNKANELLKTMEAGIGSGYTPGEFSYNAASDPQYLMALQNAYAQAGVASGNAMADFAARGILDSDVTRDRVSQIQQGAVADVNANLLPQMIQQAYQRYSDSENRKYQTSRDKVTDTASLLSSILGVNDDRQADAQQQWSNNYALNDQKFNQDMTTKQYKSSEDQRGIDNKYRADAFTYQQGRDKVSDDQWLKQFNEQVKQNGVQNALAWAQQEISKENAKNSNALGWAELDQRKAEFDWDKEQQKIKEQGLGDDMVNEAKGMVDALRSGQLNAGQAYKQIEEDTKLGFYTPEQSKYLTSMLQEMAPSQPQPAVTELQKEAISALPSDKVIEAEAKSKGLPTLDYLSWYKSAKGKTAGLDFETWQKLYGPRLQ